jgi:hypothetical protein
MRAADGREFREVVQIELHQAVESRPLRDESLRNRDAVDQATLGTGATLQVLTPYGRHEPRNAFSLFNETPALTFEQLQASCFEQGYDIAARIDCAPPRATRMLMTRKL